MVLELARLTLTYTISRGNSEIPFLRLGKAATGAPMYSFTSARERFIYTKSKRGEMIFPSIEYKPTQKSFFFFSNHLDAAVEHCPASLLLPTPFIRIFYVL